jgi:hypothetical protein
MNQNKLKINISRNDFKFSKQKDKNQVIEGKLYVYNINDDSSGNKKEKETINMKKKVLLSLLRFRDSMQLIEGTVDVSKMLRAKSLNLKCNLLLFLE